MWTIFSCETKQRVSEETYATYEEANHDYYMNYGVTYIGLVESGSLFPKQA